MRAFGVFGVVLFGVALGSGQAHLELTPAEATRQAEIWNAASGPLAHHADFYFEKGDFNRVITTLWMRYQLFPENEEIVTDLGWLLESTDRPGEALALYVKFRQTVTGYPDRAYPEAWFHFRRKAYAKVPPILEPTMTSRTHPNSWRILAHAYERIGQLADSMRTWDRYLAIAPNDQAAKNNRDRVERKLRASRD